MENENPFAAPSQPVEVIENPVAAHPATPKNLGAIAKRTFIAWEKLRFLYVAILGLITIAALMYSGPINNHKVDFWILLCFGAVVANLCYFLAPIVETYLVWLGFPAKALRIAIFAAGTIFAGILAFFTVTMS